MNTIQSSLHKLDIHQHGKSNEQSTMHSSFNTISTVCSSVDEENISLQSHGYHDEYISSTHKKFAALEAAIEQEATRNKNAVIQHALLQERMNEFLDDDSGKQQQLCNSTRRGSWNTLAASSGGHKIEFATRGNDASAFRMSTIVHKMKKQHCIVNDKAGTKKKQRSAPYSLMTKMMKHNAILKRAASKGSTSDSGKLVGNEHITAAHNGSFFFSANVDVSSVLSSQETFDSVIDDFMSKTNEIEKDLAEAAQGAGIKSKLRRRKRLQTAYNRTML